MRFTVVLMDAVRRGVCRRTGTGARAVLWGCDMEEPRPQALIQALAAANPANGELQSALTLTQGGYQRAAAPGLLQHVRSAGAINDVTIGGVSLRDSIIRTLEIEVDRMSPNTRLQASTRREMLMKELFFGYWQSNGRPRVMLRFGGNHLHRGIDSRGVSTLGNFVAELAAANGDRVFNVVEFAGGGQIALGGGRSISPGYLDDPASGVSRINRTPSRDRVRSEANSPGAASGARGAAISDGITSGVFRRFLRRRHLLPERHAGKTLGRRVTGTGFRVPGSEPRIGVGLEHHARAGTRSGPGTPVDANSPTSGLNPAVCRRRRGIGQSPSSRVHSRALHSRDSKGAPWCGSTPDLFVRPRR